jgi:hypothetical protein
LFEVALEEAGLAGVDLAWPAEAGLFLIGSCLVGVDLVWPAEVRAFCIGVGFAEAAFVGDALAGLG